MKKLLVILSFLVLLMTHAPSAYSSWYGNHSVSAPNPGWFNLGGTNRWTRCNSDGDTTWWSHSTHGEAAVANNNHPTSLTPETDAEFTIPAWRSIRCLYWDAQGPQNLSVTYDSGFHGTSWAVLTIQARDRWGARLNRIDIRESRNGGGYTTIHSFTSFSEATNVLATRTWTRVPTAADNNVPISYQITVSDRAGNSATYTNSSEIRFDLTPPSWTVTYTTADGNTYIPDTWTDQDVTVSISCSDTLSGCDMSPRAWWVVSWNTYVRTYTNNASNISGNLTIQDDGGNSVNMPYGPIKIDKTTPWVPGITADDRSNDEWSNDTDTTITSSVNRVGEVSPRFNRYCMVKDPITDCTPNALTGPNTSSLTEGIYYYRVRTCTQSGNCGAVSTFIIKIDTTPPSLSDIGVPSPVSGSNLLATDSQSFSLTVAESGSSSITEIVWYFEDYTTINSYRSTPFTSSNNTLSITPSIQDVDNDSNPLDGVRNYKYKVTRICDAAWNCLEAWNNATNDLWLVNYNYNVYANTDVANFSQRLITPSQVNDIQDSNNIADGTPYTVTVRLADQYGNNIIPTSGAVDREVNFGIESNNTVYLNQLLRSWDSGVRISTPSGGSSSSVPIGVNTVSYPNQPSTDGTYDFTFYVYTPTNQYELTGWADPLSRFIIDNFTFNLTHSSQSSWDRSSTVDNGSSINFNFWPMFQTEFNGELEATWFLEWAIQYSNITVTNHSLRPISNAGSRKMYLKYNGDAPILNNLELEFSQSNPPSEIVSEGPSLVSDIPSGSFTTTTYNLYTRLSQGLWSTIDAIESTYLSTHFSYILDGLTVVVNSDVIGRNNYFDTVVQNSTNQAWVKVLWLSASDKIQELTNDQFTDDVRIIGKLTKAWFRKDISQRVFGTIRSLPDFAGTNPRVGELWSGWETAPQNNGQMIFNDTIIVYKNIGGQYVEIPGDIVTWNKTIVVVWGDVYVTGNIINSTAVDTLWIISLKDSAWNGGSIYVNNDVTDLHSVLYAEKVLMTAIGDIDGNRSIDDSNSSIEVLNSSTTSSQLNNQLYIYGSVFSENTIGWSRANPIECPFYINCADSIEAQKYDLNYVRRYIQIDHDNDPLTPLINANGWATAQWTLSTTNQGFPLVIEYNSAVQSSPPPLFK